MGCGSQKKGEYHHVAEYAHYQTSTIKHQSHFKYGRRADGLLEYWRYQLENLSRGSYSHVGNALNELAFRISIMLGFEGRITLEAVRETHYFYFKNGFRLNNNFNYYLSLAERIYDANGTRIKIGGGDAILYLPKEIIERKVKQFCPEMKVTISATETVEESRWIQHFEQLLLGAEKRTMQFQVILALTKDFGLRIDYPVITVLERFHSQKNENSQFMLMLKKVNEKKRTKKRIDLYMTKLHA